MYLSSIDDLSKTRGRVFWSLICLSRTDVEKFVDDLGVVLEGRIGTTFITLKNNDK